VAKQLAALTVVEAPGRLYHLNVLRRLDHRAGANMSRRHHAALARVNVVASHDSREKC
jgi:hypothetical protein